MTLWVTRPKRLAGAIALLAAIAWAQPAAAEVPILGAGAHVGVGYHIGPNALDVLGDVSFAGMVLSGQYWQQLAAPSMTYGQVGLRTNLSPVPMLSIAPGVGAVVTGGNFGPMASLTAGFAPFLLPVAVEASAGAAYVLNAGTLFPYYAGVKFSPLPFTALALRYRGWGGAASPTMPMAGVAGPEIGVEIGI
jgi:hypothetical protein